MWLALNLAKRVEGAEQGVEKLASMIEDFVRDIGVTYTPVPATSEEGDAKDKEGGAKDEEEGGCEPQKEVK